MLTATPRDHSKKEIIYARCLRCPVSSSESLGREADASRQLADFSQKLRSSLHHGTTLKRKLLFQEKKQKYVYGSQQGSRPCQLFADQPNADDPYGIRTRVTAVKGRCLNRLTKGPLE
jgi:hypothetical protein